jgi:diguanylate cyclase (GGDEF)-like protein
MREHRMSLDLKQIRNAVWSQPDPLLVAAGLRGEMLVAKTRLGLTAILLLIPLSNGFFGSNLPESLVGLGAAASVILISLIAYILIGRDYHRPWLGFATSCFDVTLVTTALCSFLLMGQPHTAVNSKVIFEGYFLAFAATTLRYDKRICVVAGLLALAEYAAVVTIASTNWDLNNHELYAPFSYGMFSWNAQISRLIMMLIAALLSLAVVSRTQQLLRLSTSDPLTSLFNRGYFGERVAAEVSRASRHRQSLTIAMVDVDHFKWFNDQHGHAAGDKVLQTIAAMLRHSFRKSDIVARYGGEEFVIAMPETDTDAACRKLEDFRQTIAATPIVTASGKPVYITISAGLAGLPSDGTKDEDLIDVADARLFQAKRNGRNQIVVCSSAESEAETTPASKLDNS